jgi:hypothetical protein
MEANNNGKQSYPQQFSSYQQPISSESAAINIASELSYFQNHLHEIHGYWGIPTKTISNLLCTKNTLHHLKFCSQSNDRLVGGLQANNDFPNF